MHDYIDNIASENIFDDGKFLLDNGANINIQDDKGDTFLHHFTKTYRYSRVYFISLKTYINFIEFLIENGADPLLENKEGKSSYSIVMYEVKKQEHILDRLNSIYSYPPFKDKIKENIYSMSKDEIKDMLNIIKNDINESCYNNTRDSTDRDNMVRLCEIFYSFMNEG
jgi:ankyrin repeat protein